MILTLVFAFMGGFLLGWVCTASRTKASLVRADHRRRNPWHVAVRPGWHNNAEVRVVKRGFVDVLAVAVIKADDARFSEKLAEAKAVAEERASDLNAMEI